MRRLWMPLYVPDYRADTAHLGALEHGVYLLLIMHYWLTGALPDDDKQLARISCTTDAQWRKCRPTIEKFFEPGWRHNRIDKELAKAADISDKRRDAANNRHRADIPIDTAIGPAIAEQEHTPLQLPSPLPRSINKLGIDLGEEVKKRKVPPHGSVGNGRIWISAASQDWETYAEDYRRAHGEYPKPDVERGGKWFRVAGEQRAVASG